MLPDDVKVDIRRHLGYPPAGLPMVGPSGQLFASGMAGFRWNQIYGLLEWRLDNLHPAEESRLAGLAYGAVGIVTPTVQAGTTVTVTLSGGPLGGPVTVTYVVQAADTPITVAAGLAAQGSQNATLASAGITVRAPWGTGTYAMLAQPLPQVAFVCPEAFTIAASATGATGVSLLAQGQLPPPQAVDGSTNPPTVLHGYVPVLNYIEGAIVGATQNLDTLRADVWSWNPREIQDRIRLYRTFRAQLARMLGVPLDYYAGDRDLVAVVG